MATAYSSLTYLPTYLRQYCGGGGIRGGVPCRCSRGLGYVDDKSLERLSVLFPRLGSVELRLCSVTDDGLARFCAHNQRDGGLARLTLDQPGDISDSALTTLADHCPRLEHLTLAHCPRVTGAGLRSVLVTVYPI